MTLISEYWLFGLNRFSSDGESVPSPLTVAEPQPTSFSQIDTEGNQSATSEVTVVETKTSLSTNTLEPAPDNPLSPSFFTTTLMISSSLGSSTNPVIPNSTVNRPTFSRNSFTSATNGSLTSSGAKSQAPSITPPPSDADQTLHAESHTSLILGAVLGSVFGTFVICASLLLVRRHRRRQWREERSEEGEFTHFN